MEMHLNFNQSRQESSTIFTLKFSPDSTLLAVGKSDGHVSIYDDTLSLKQTIDCKLNEFLPISSVKWRPSQGMTRNILLVAGTEGFISHYHATTGNLISQQSLDPGDQALVCDFSPDGDYFAVGCKTPAVRIYDESTKSLFISLQKHGDNLGHSNRICSLSYFKENLIMTGGWDNNIYIWDVRTSEVVRSFHGVNLEGDSVDIFADHVMCVDTSPHEQMKVWSLSDGRLIFSNEFEKDGKVMRGYTAQFCKHSESRRLFVGGSGKIQGYFMNRIGYQVVNYVDCLHSPIYCSDFSNSGELFVAGTQDGSLNLMKYNSII